MNNLIKYYFINVITMYGAIDRLHKLDWLDCSLMYTGNTPTAPH